MGWFEAAMQYSIYVLLGVCGACLLGSVTLFFTLERRWQIRVERDAEAVLARALYKEPVREDTVSPLQWEAIRHRIEEMQIMAEESGRPTPYKNVA
ncbi:MAG: hypothetical protein GAK35_01361 [Herbaspirillum frisingense]|uniref:Uncharacterized protein n=1 Tax=Herbaspirillum frisingense TaxID=92645 RepID=A0A7V8FY93_9BURK|nr:MAG: hypothetical protein GAK35_01361 [Herbaspirillum frisingense]